MYNAMGYMPFINITVQFHTIFVQNSDVKTYVAVVHRNFQKQHKSEFYKNDTKYRAILVLGARTLLTSLILNPSSTIHCDDLDYTNTQAVTVFSSCSNNAVLYIITPSISLFSLEMG